METVLIVGLGNPGLKYEQTRHNIGFMLLDHLSSQLGATFQNSKENKGLIAAANVDGKKLILLKPQTYMNLSGESVGRVMRYYQLSEKNLMVVSDECELPFGSLRLRERGSAGGHNGLKNIEIHLGTQEYIRLRIGIGKSEFEPLESYVLSRFTEAEREKLPGILKKASQTVEIWLQEGFPKAATFAGAKSTILE